LSLKYLVLKGMSKQFLTFLLGVPFVFNKYLSLQSYLPKFLSTPFGHFNLLLHGDILFQFFPCIQCQIFYGRSELGLLILIKHRWLIEIWFLYFYYLVNVHHISWKVESTIFFSKFLNTSKGWYLKAIIFFIIPYNLSFLRCNQPMSPTFKAFSSLFWSCVDDAWTCTSSYISSTSLKLVGVSTWSYLWTFLP